MNNKFWYILGFINHCNICRSEKIPDVSIEIVNSKKKADKMMDDFLTKDRPCMKIREKGNGHAVSMWRAKQENKMK